MIDDLTKEKFWREFFSRYIKECQEIYKICCFNYDIPKEEQAAAALYSFCRKNGLIVEMQPNLFEDPKYNKSLVRYDMKILDSNGKQMIIEIKRATALEIWQNDYSGFLKSWNNDIEKLNNIENKKLYPRFINNPKKVFVLISFIDETKRKEKLNEKIKQFAKTVKSWKHFNLKNNVIFDITKLGYNIKYSNKLQMQMDVWIK